MKRERGRVLMIERVKMSNEDIWTFHLKLMLDGLIIFQHLCDRLLVEFNFFCSKGLFFYPEGFCFL